MANRILSIFGYLLGALLVVYILLGVLLPQQTINWFGFRTFVVVSRSMEPVINVNDMIIITRAEEEDIDTGDIITFRAHIPELGDYGFVTHYVGDVLVDGSGNEIYKTQGATADPDDYDEWTDGQGNPIEIQIDDVVGKYQFRIPRAGILISMLRDPIFVGLLAINGTIIYFIVKLIRSPKETVKEPNDNTKEKES